MTEAIVSNIWGMPVYESDRNPLVLAQIGGSEALTCWFIDVLCKRDKDFAFEHAVMGLEWIKQQYDMKQLAGRYNRVTGNTRPHWNAHQ